MSQNLAISFVKEIKALGFEVPKLQISNIGGLSFVSAYEEIPETIMANEASAGVDYNADLAITKALVEHFERRVFSEGVDQGDPICHRRHSDGIAAYPRSAKGAHSLARDNAYSEALERYVWANWWDDETIGFSSKPLEQTNFWGNVKLKMTMEQFSEIAPVESINVIEPFFESSDHSVLILFARIKGYGFISGGAAGSSKKRSEILIRALAELIRHGLALTRFIESQKEPVTFYERRLIYFGLGHGNQLVEDRLRKISENILRLPPLEIDSEIKSDKLGQLIATHRCLFRDQPPFVDGKLERLCL
jgi:hypothetical protein